MKFNRQFCLALCATLSPALVYAQATARANAADAAVTTPKFEYRSAFTDYRAWNDDPAGSWQALNAEAGRLGGHAGQLAPARKTATPAQSESPPGAGTPAQKMAPDHRMHQMK